MIQYYSPQFSLATLIKSLFTFNAEKKIIGFFKKYTKKEYILITNNCRSALFLSYKALPKIGEVITNPLTCRDALKPIIASGNKIMYSDIDKDNLTMQIQDLERLINKNTIAIQATHQGGFLCNVAKIHKAIGIKEITIIEDCAQGFLSNLNGEIPGKYSEVLCFSLIKNAYGIGGGILATNNHSIFLTAKNAQSAFAKNSLILIFFRIIRNLLETNRRLRFFDYLYHKLMKNRKKIKKYKSDTSLPSMILLKPTLLELKISWVQLQKADKLNKLRKESAERLMAKLKQKGLMSNYLKIDKQESVFTKFFLVNEKFNSVTDIIKLNKAGIECKHLENKYNEFYQNRLDRSIDQQLAANIHECSNYLDLHDKLISLPLTEVMSEEVMDKVVMEITKIVRHEKNDLV
jgi:dTDP-4-amino-4,6-dideoxygalactose transaminase